MTRLRSALTTLFPLLAPAAGLCLLVGIVSSVGILHDALLTGLINLVVVIGLWIFIGNSGVLSFGHIGFMAIGAYTSALLTIPEVTKAFLLPQLPGLLRDTTLSAVPATAIAVLVVGAIAVVVGMPLMRLSGLAASIATLSGLIIVNVVISNWTALTAGTGTLARIPTTTNVGSALVVALGAMAVGFAFRQSRAGLRLRASREDLVAAQASGVREVRLRLLAFTISAMVVAAGGTLYAHDLGSISPDAFYFETTFLTIAMLVVGGMNSLLGAVVGTATISVISEILSRLENSGALPVGTQGVVLSLVVIAILILRPQGITRGREAELPRRRGKGAPNVSPAPSPTPPVEALTTSQQRR